MRALIQALLVLLLLSLLAACGGQATPLLETGPSGAMETSPTSAAAATLPPPTPTELPPASPCSSAGCSYTARVVVAPAGSRITSLAYSPASELLAYAVDGDLRIHLLDTSSEQEVKVLEGHVGTIDQLAFSPDGAFLASSGSKFSNEDTQLRLWDVQSGAQLAAVPTEGIYQLVYTPDGNSITAYESAEPNRVRVWDASTLADQVTLDNFASGYAIATAGDLLAAPGVGDDMMHILSLPGGEELYALPGHTVYIGASAFSPDDAILAVGDSSNNILLWDLATKQVSRTLAGHTSRVETLFFSPEGSILASLGSGVQVSVDAGRVNMTRVGEDRTLRFWAVTDGSPVGEIKLETEIVAAAFNLDWTLVITGGMDGSIQFWQPAR